MNLQKMLALSLLIGSNEQAYMVNRLERSEEQAKRIESKKAKQRKASLKNAQYQARKGKK